MNFFPFSLGLLIGVCICVWRQRQINRQLRQILDSSAKQAELITSLSAISLVRREINRLNQKQQQLVKELQIWEELLDQAPIGYLRIDGDNQLLWCNQQARQLLQIRRWQPGQVRLLLELVRSYELDQLIERTRQSQQPQIYEWVFYATQYADSDTLANSYQAEAFSSYQTSVALKATSYYFSQGQVGVFLLNQQALVELSQSRERAFSDLLHELRTPLTSIHLVAETLQKRLENPERSWVDKMLVETERLIDLVQNWLDLSKLQENPGQHLQYQSVELRGLIRSAWQTLEPLAKQKGLTLTYLGPDQLTLQGDQSRLMQVFLNLLDNSIKHSPNQSKIRVKMEVVAPKLETGKASSYNDWVNIDVIDSGFGFSKSDLPHVFERLYRGDSSRTRQPASTQFLDMSFPRSGSGLGLAIVKQIVQAHGGSIQAKNHPETGGAWLQLFLPRNNYKVNSDSELTNF